MCTPCSNVHRTQLCHLFDFPTLRKLWYAFLTRNFQPVEQVLDFQLPECVKISAHVRVSPATLKDALAQQIQQLGCMGFTVGAAYVESTFLSGAKPKSKAPIPLMATTQQQVRTARRLMREWEIATSKAQRQAVVGEIKKFLDPVPVHEEELRDESEHGGHEDEAEEEEPQRKIQAKSRKRNDEYLVLWKAAEESKSCRYVHQGWLDVDPSEVVEAHPSKLIWLDPFYQPEFQPKVVEAPRMRQKLDAMSQAGTVVLIFGRLLELYRMVPHLRRRLHQKQSEVGG